MKNDNFSPKGYSEIDEENKREERFEKKKKRRKGELTVVNQMHYIENSLFY